ncbi:stalk domain-containing protein [Peptoniphilus sp.]|uniref:stalk domain-containing protein n=1 Tax=Peptoniphilus sp. TaxID=1971214 RepID=UPI0039931F60
MKGKKRRIEGFILILVMIIGCIPLKATSTYAEDGYVEINETNFPDKNFREYVKIFDNSNDGTLSQEECNNVKYIYIPTNFDYVDSKVVHNLIGIEHFKNLKILNCGYNQIKELDLSNNTALTQLNCSNNQLTELDLSNNIALTELRCGLNPLKELNLSNNTALIELYCYNNQLTNLDLSNNTVLKKLYCYNNHLTYLDINNNKALAELNCGNNQLTELDLINKKALTKLNFGNNQLTNLDISNNTVLTELICELNPLKELNLSNNRVLTGLYCYNNQLTNLDLSNNTILTKLSCGKNSLKELDLSKNKSLTELYCHDNQLTHLDLSNNTALTKLDFYNNKLKRIDLSNNKFITRLICSYNNLTELNLSKNNALTELDCDDNQLIHLDLSNNKALKELGCMYNNLTELNLNQNTSLTSLRCNNNKLKKLDLSNNKALEKLGCWDNDLTELNLSQNTSLKELNCINNPLTSLQIVDKEYSIKELSPVTYIVKVEEGITKIPFNALPQAFAKDMIKGPVTGAEIEEDGFTWDSSINPIKFKYQLCESPKEVVFAELRILPEVAGPKDITPPNQNPNLPVLDISDHTQSTPVMVNIGKANLFKTIKLKVRLVIGSKEIVNTTDGVEERIMMDVVPFIESDRTMLPIRFVAEALGFNVMWNNDDRTVILIDKENIVKIPVDTNKIIVNEKEYISDVKPVIRNDRTMLPIGNIARALGLQDGKNIHWNENTKEVIITREALK